ncbi:hypothetical protein PRNP1_015095 [Phytophthora ramorum]
MREIALTNVKIQKLPPNTSAYLQPLDAGIIASFKARFRSLQIDRAIERFHSGEDVDGRLIYKIDQLQAMKWSQELWVTMLAATVAHCWQKTGLAAPLRGVEEYETDGEWYGEEEDSDDNVVHLMMKVASIQL